MAVVSRQALIAPETFDAWVRAFKDARGSPHPDLLPPCPNCGRFDLRLEYVADVESRIGFAALWSPYCGHGVTFRRVYVPDGAEFLPLDAEAAVLTSRIPTFHEVQPARTSASAAAGLSEAEQRILDAITEHGPLSARDLERHVTPSMQIRRRIRDLLELGLIERTGRGRNVRYTVARVGDGSDRASSTH